MKIAHRVNRLTRCAAGRFMPDVRGGKGAYWCTFVKDVDWKERLLENSRTWLLAKLNSNAIGCSINRSASHVQIIKRTRVNNETSIAKFWR